METFERIRKVVQRLTRAFCYCGMVLLLPMMFLTSIDVVGRDAFSRPIPGIIELTSYMLAVFILSGIAYTHQCKEHVSVTILTSRLSEKPRLILSIASTLLSMSIISVMAWQGFVIGLEEHAVSDMLRIAEWPFKILVGAAGVFLFFELLIDLAISISLLTRKRA